MNITGRRNSVDALMTKPMFDKGISVMAIRNRSSGFRVINVRTQNFQEFCKKIHFITIL